MCKSKDPAEVWRWIEHHKDPVKALEGRARSKRGAARKAAESEARFKEAHEELTKSGFLSRPLVKYDIAKKDTEALRGKVAEHLAELQAKKEFGGKEGYQVLDDIDVSEQFGDYKTKAEAEAEAEAAVPEGKTYPLYELGDKVWRRLTNIDVLVLRDVKGQSKSEVIRFEEVKSGCKRASMARKQQQTIIDALAKIAAGDDNVRLHHHRWDDITDQINASTMTADKAKTVGPANKKFELSLGVTQKELNDLVKKIIEDA